MRKIASFVFFGMISNFFCFEMLYAEKNENESDRPIYVVAGGRGQLSPFPQDNETSKILKRSEIEREGYNLAKQGLYVEAIAKYEQALDASLLNQESDKSTALWSIRDIHQRQGKLDQALKEHEWFLKANPTKDEYLDKDRELRALVKARDEKSNRPIYDHIIYLRTKYKKYIPPQSQGDSGYHAIPINDIIHLYDWMGDTDGGIKFISEVLSSKTLYSNERKEYEDVKTAFEEDKRTGQNGHLQKAIQASSIIGW